MESNNWRLEARLEAEQDSMRDSIKPQPSRGIKVLIQIIKWLFLLFFIEKTPNCSWIDDY